MGECRGGSGGCLQHDRNGKGGSGENGAVKRAGGRDGGGSSDDLAGVNVREGSGVRCLVKPVEQ